MKFPFVLSRRLRLLIRMRLTLPSKSYLNFGFAEFPEQVFESRFSCFVVVGKQNHLVVGDGPSVAGEFVELLSGDFFAAEADGGGGIRHSQVGILRVEFPF